ncbi:deleted in lung and esophageal cancer protein 1-like [Physella acuta]|uniref:deleted in lung and esophageal cancer protein 1-like n=1 Tax=Physella acuta TaxID=109671 RepID=UPI0027DE349D|nr:deleted in lung and esophageal cancer protein 1-like [Physella acuta]
MSQMSTHTSNVGQELPMYIQRPSSSQSQDVRHILAKCFRDLYTRDTIRPETVKNLQISKGGDDPYHERYVENLQKAHTEWQRRMDEAAMLERHIMQAQARAMSADERELNKATASCENYASLGLPPVRAHFPSCIDTQLLQSHGLLTPSDYMTYEQVPVSAPQGPKVPDYARETLASRQHSRPNTQMELESPMAWLAGDSMECKTILSENVQDQDKELKALENKQAEFPKKSGWKEFLSEEQREADRKALDMLHSKVNFLKNPRFIPPSELSDPKSLLLPKKKISKQLGKNVEPEISSEKPVFIPYPPVVEFTNYKVGEVYEITLELKNMSAVMRQLRVLPPSSNIFSIGLGQFPGETGLVAPGMSCRYNIRFAPNSLKNYDDSITVQTQAKEPLIIPLQARRPPPVLTLPKEVDLGCCLVGDIQVYHLMVKNEGGHGRFCLMARNKWPSTSIRTALPNTKPNKQVPFEIVPPTFELGPNQTIMLEAIFSPLAEKVYTQEMTITCDNCQASHFKIKGEGQTARVDVVDIERGASLAQLGEMSDISAELLLRFDDLNPYTYTERSISILNYTNVELPFKWMVYKPIIDSSMLLCEYQEPTSQAERVLETNGVFSVHPPSGVLKPSETAVFKVTFAPPKEDDYHSCIHMVLPNIPTLNEDKYKIPEYAGNSSEEDLLPATVHKFKNVTGIQMEVKGKCVPLYVVLHPYALLMQAKILVGTSAKRLFTMANHSYSTISFKWESYTDSYLLEVEPRYGELDPGMAIDLELSITGVEPCYINHTLLCHVMNLPEPLHLNIQAEFIGPEVSILQPIINFGLVRIGQHQTREMTLRNNSELKVSVAISESQEENSQNSLSQETRDLTFSVTECELRPLECKDILVTYTPKHFEKLKRVCEVQCNGVVSSSIAIVGEAQNPVVCLLESHKVLTDVFLNAPVSFTATLHNQTLLPTVFKWGKVEGLEKEFCKIEIEESEGKLLSWEQKHISFIFTPLKAISFSDVGVSCSIEGQQEELYLNISCAVKTLELAFKISKDKTVLSDELCLDFGTNSLGQIVRRYLHVYNKTSIRASFKIHAEYFVATSPSPPELKDISTSHSIRRNLISRTPNITEPVHGKASTKLNAEWNKFILKENRGAVFQPCPVSGELLPYGEQVIEVVACSNMWGTYQDQLTFQADDLEPVRIPVSLTSCGCPLSFQLTAGQPDLKPIVRFGSHTAGSKVITRHLKINNSSPNDIRVDWQVFEMSDSSEKVIDFILVFGESFPLLDEQGNEIEWSVPAAKETSAENCEAGEEDFDEKLFTCCVRTHEGNIATRPFNITPKQLVIPGHGSNSVDLTFTALSTDEVFEETDLAGFAFGYLSLDKEEHCNTKVRRKQGYEADQLRIDFTANLKPALLTIEETDDEGMIFRGAMSDIMKNGQLQKESLQVSSVMFTNNTLTPLTFKIKVSDPFVLTNLETTKRGDENKMATETLPCSLNPQQNLLVKVALKVSQAVLYSKDFLTLKDQKLEIYKQMVVRFSNGMKQKIPLLGILSVPQFELSTNILDFGICLVGQTRKMEFTIENTSASHSYWTITPEQQIDDAYDGSEAFLIEPNQGTLEAYITHVSNSKTVISAYFNARHCEPYDCTYVVQGNLGESVRRIHLTGLGSYDGKYEAILNI